MNATRFPPSAVEESVDPATSALLRALLVCDLVDSTGLVERLGDRATAELIRKHDRLARTIADRHGGREIDKTDGFLMMFERPIQAVAYALDYQRGLRQLNAAEGTTLSARVGIHVGDVVVWDNSEEDVARGAKPTEVEGLVKPITSRLMNLALPNQILLSNIAYVLAHRAQGELGISLDKVRWRTHGRYRFRGIPDPVPVFEVGEDGLAPLKAPPWSSKAHREVPFWRRPATMVIEGLVVLALLAIPLYSLLKPEPAIAFANRDWVVVGSLNNLTGESVFDEALESALKIGLEQSKYVNVLPDLKVRDTVKRMERDPDATRVDRAVGSEVAIRDGAKALIVPTVAEIGGRVRITAEVIDPHTQTTVYSESADGVGAESVLGSLDTINGKLRVRLGEALATVSNESQPLQQVATANLDALRAYSLGSRNYMQGRFSEAMELYRQALAIDPEFAAAHLRIGAAMTSLGKNAEARDAFVTATAQAGRLAMRERLYLESMVATLDGREDALTKWAALTELYPDFFTASGGYTYVAWRDANRFDDAIVKVAEAGVSARNPSPLPAKLVLGILYLGNERHADAIRTFRDAEAGGLTFTQYHAAAHAAQRRHDEAAAVLARTPVITATQNPAASNIRTLLETAFLVDAGRFREAAGYLERAREELPAAHPLAAAWEAAILGMELHAGVDRDARLARIRVLAEATVAERDAAQPLEKASLDARLALLAWFGARLGDPVLAERTLALAGKPGAHASYALASKMRRVAAAELARVRGDAAAAVRELAPLLDGSEPYLAHVTLMEAHADAGRLENALAEARWLSTHRGRAYAETGAGSLLMLAGVEQSNLALLRGAEIAAARADARTASTQLQAFQGAWGDASRSGALATRVKKVQSALP